jgi:hypothetical protein
VLEPEPPLVPELSPEPVLFQYQSVDLPPPEPHDMQKQVRIDKKNIADFFIIYSLDIFIKEDVFGD